MYGVKALEQPAVGFALYVAKQGKKLESSRSKASYQINCAASVDVTEFVAALTTILAPRKRKVLLLLNPFGGTKKAKNIYTKTVKKMLDVAPNMEYELLETTHAGHAREHLFGLQSLHTYSAGDFPPPISLPPLYLSFFFLFFSFFFFFFPFFPSNCKNAGSFVVQCFSTLDFYRTCIAIA